MCLSALTLSACNDILVTEGTVVAKIAVGKNGCGLEDYGFIYVTEGFYIVVNDGTYQQVFQARNEKTWNTAKLDEEWEYSAIDWIVWAEYD